VNNYAVLPATQTRGGILLAVAENYFTLSDTQLTTNAITSTISMRADDTKWQITVVYGPQGDDTKLQFLQELKNIPRPIMTDGSYLGISTSYTKQKIKITQTSTSA
jgi:hypothetical protein